MSDPREEIEKAIRNRELINQLDAHEAYERSKLPTSKPPEPTPTPSKPSETEFQPDVKETQPTPEVKETLVVKIPKVTEKTKRIASPRMKGYYIDPKYKLDDVIQDFYDKSNYPSQAEVRRALETSGLAAKDQFKPKNLDEGANRALYAITETIGGGIREATFGLSGSLGAENRPGGILFQIAGGLATPTVADMMATYTVGKALQTKTGRALLKKFHKFKGAITAPDALTPSQIDELEQLLKVDDPDFWKTKEGRELFERLSKRVDHFLEHPEQYTAGASVVPEDVYWYQTLDKDITPDIYDKFIAKYGDRVDLSTQAMVAIMVESTPKAGEVLDDVADYNLEKPIPSLEEREKAEPGETTTPGEEQEQPPSGGLGEITDTPQKIEEVPDETTVTTPTPTPTTPEPPTPEPTFTEPPTEPPTSIFVPKNYTQLKTRIPKVKLGKKRSYQVVFQYNSGAREYRRVDAIDYIDAYYKAARSRDNNAKPIQVELEAK